MDMDLTGKNALVCGSSGGIGKASAIALSQLGVNVTLLSRNKEALNEALKELDRSKNQHHDFIIADTSDTEDFRKKLSDLVSQKIIHVLVNNSGGPPPGNILGADTKDFEKAFAQHLLANHTAAQVLIPGMKQSGYGRIINIISTSVKQPLHGLGVSNTIRAAVANWSKTLATELAPFGITVNNVLPGGTETDRHHAIMTNKASRTGKDIEQIKKEMLAEIPMGRFAKPEEIANAVAFLASPAAAYIQEHKSR
jgi:3-oxoacyl-[acyl-carrier protein] reductase